MSDRRPKKPKNGVPELTIAQQWRQVRNNALKGLTPRKYSQALDQFDYGYVRQAAMIWEALEDRDDMAKTVIPKRKKSVSRRKWEVIMTEQSARAEEHKRSIEDLCNHITATDALDRNVKGGMALLIRQMMDAQFKQYAVHEIIWQITRDRVRAELRFVPLYLFENRTGRLRYTGPLGMTDGRDLEEDGWMITCGDGLMKAIGLCAVLKGMSMKDWLSFSERFGIPGVQGITDAPKGSPEWNAAVEALSSFVSEWVSLTSKGTEIKLIEAGKTGDAPFKPLYDLMNAAIARLVRGADLSTISAADAAGASLQGDESQLLEEDDCELISEAINTQLVRPMIAMLYGEEPLAYFKIQPPKNQDVNADMAVDKHLKEMGVPLAVADIAERYDRTLPEAGEQLVGEPAPAEETEEAMPGPGLANADDDVPADEQLVREGVVADLQPVFEALANALKAGDDKELESRLKELQAKWPEIVDEVLAGSAAERAIESALGSAFVEGLDVSALVEDSAGFENANHYPRQKGGRFGIRIGVSREKQTKPNRDMFGERVSPKITPAKNLERGVNALAWAKRNSQGVNAAMYRAELGPVDFPWGSPGDRMNDYQGGSGLSHILAKHGEKDLDQLPGVLVDGTLAPHPDDTDKHVIERGNYRAILARHSSKRKRNWWVLTGFTRLNPRS